MNIVFRLATPLAMALTFILTLPPPGQAQITPKGDSASRDYWLRESTILDDKDPRSIKAHTIFKRVLDAADKRPGPSPELYILDEEGFPWARSLPDGAVILTRGAIDVCLQAKSESDADARLAFILGHELSHQVNGDFWHFFFYQGLNPVQAEDKETRETLEHVKEIAKSGDSISAKELQADQYGLLYASQAGYNVKRIVAEDTNFFREWTAATNPAMLEGVIMQINHPKIEERSASALLALARVVEKIELFDQGVLAYKNGGYSVAKDYFEEFLSVYQSREAFNNLGLVYYQMAADEYIQWKPGDPGFRLSLIIDPSTRASETFLETGRALTSFGSRFRTQEIDPHESLFNKYADMAERYFREASDRDHTYAMSHNNMACVHFLRAEYSSAVGELDMALRLDPDLAEAYNNRAVAYLKLAQKLKVNLDKKVESSLLEALKVKPDYADAMFNLAYFYKQAGRDKDSEVYKKRFAKANPDSELLQLLQ